jgi:hypothetical protein
MTLAGSVVNACSAESPAAASELEPRKPPAGICSSYTQSRNPWICTGLSMTSSAESDSSVEATADEGKRASEARQKYANVILQDRQELPG